MVFSYRGRSRKPVLRQDEPVHSYRRASPASRVLFRVPPTPTDALTPTATCYQPTNLHLTSALLATHLTSALLPLRLKTGRISLSTLVQKLNWRGDTRIIGLSGRAPVWDVNASATAVGKAVVEGWDFSTMRGKASEVGL